MEIVNPSAYYENLKRYWRRRRYQRLNGENYSNKRKLKITRLGGSGHRRQWRIRSTPKLRLSFIVSPIKLLAKFHDSYVNMMLRLAGNVGKSNSVDLFGGKRVPKGRQISMVSGGEEVDGSYVEAVPLAILLELAGNL
ncbi:hypothetical protein F2P56_010856 [Juglans regia]|uniref:Uncharacterized protein n=2 Tax=Juglans regia TaxID=51240 RepID=A0A833XLJ7_JUGRE|nr:uncharacterized protein LOC109022105 [Juglans regia]KAF5470336.1 hypothetical protein F2P56_010856 [Juglans regia]